jgi:chromosome partitioning protein
MIKIAMFNQKGGVSKSSASVNIAACLDFKFKKKVLVMDCDAQQNSSLQLLGKRCDQTIRKILDNETTLDKCIYPVSFESGGKIVETGIDVLATGMDIDLLGPTDPYAYKKLTDQLEDKYDYCLLDCPPQKMATAITSLCACDYVLVPVWTETDESIQGWEMVIDLFQDLKNKRYNETMELLGVLVTRTNMNRVLDKQLMEHYRSLFDNILFDAYINDAQDIRDSYMLRKPVIYHKKNCRASKDYIAVTKELIKRIDDMNGKAGL